MIQDAGLFYDIEGAAAQVVMYGKEQRLQGREFVGWMDQGWHSGVSCELTGLQAFGTTDHLQGSLQGRTAEMQGGEHANTGD
jgi:hypothetical protein